MVVFPAPDGPTIAATCPGSIVKLTSFRICLVGAVVEADLVELDPAAERRRAACARRVADEALDVEHFPDALVADRRLGDGVGHLREVAHGLVHLAQVPDEEDERAGGELPGQGQPRAVPQHQARADRDDHPDHRRQLGLDTPRLEAGFDVGQALGVESLLFVVLPRKGLDDPDRRQHFLDDRQQVAFLLAHRARGLLDPPRVAVDHQEEHRHHRQGNEREAPVEIEHHPDHAGQGRHADEHAEQRGVDEGLDGFDVARDARDQVARSHLVVLGERQSLNVVVEGPAQVVSHPLTHAGRQVLVEIRTDGADNRNARHGGHGEVQHGIRPWPKTAVTTVPPGAPAVPSPAARCR